MLDQSALYKDLSLDKMTDNQKEAVVCKKLPILLSASAGSGKTFVLSTRVVYNLVDPNQEMSPEKLLVVTFTRAAASEMRSRISSTLQSLISKHPENQRLLRQQALLPQASISTIDAFCQSILKEQFESANLSPNFRVGNASEIEKINSDALDEIFEKKYQKDPDGFQKFCDYFSLKDDEGLRNLVLDLFRHARTRPFPEKYLDDILNDYQNPENLNESKWANVVTDFVSDEIMRIYDIFMSAIPVCEQDGVLYQSFKEPITNMANSVKSFLDVIKNTPYDEVFNKFVNVAFAQLPRRSAKTNPFDIGLGKIVREDYVKPAKKQFENLKTFFFKKEDFEEDLKSQLPIISQLISITKELIQKTDELKQEKNLIDFPDAILKTLELLVERKDGKISRTPLGETYASRFDEILVDEYQDINEAQDMLFRALSKDSRTLFMVGDVKQSIYRFREANPYVFLNRRKLYIEDPSKGTLIQLTNNFRSRKEVTGVINYMFGQIMTEDFGGVNYCEGEQLRSSGTFPSSSNCSAELHALGVDGNADERLQEEANHIAMSIKKMISDGFLVNDNGSLRPCTPGDFAVLFRSGNHVAEKISESLKNHDIPSRLSGITGYFDAREVSLMISLLKVIDNPMLDIHLLAVMISPMFGFSPDEIAIIKNESKSIPLYACLQQSGSEKAIEFLDTIKKLRALAAVLPVSLLIQQIYNETIFYSLFGAQESSEQKLANLRLLLFYSEDYEKRSDGGLTGFLRMIDREKENGKGFDCASILSENLPAVKIMTIHKSKGLEFPIVFVSRCGTSFNEEDFKKSSIFSDTLGFGMKCSKPENFARYPSLPYLACVCAEKTALRAEELRVLYVAMTRAKEKLILVSSLSATDYAKSKHFPKESILSRSIRKRANGFSDWIFPSLLRHNSIGLIHESAFFEGDEFSCSLVLKDSLCKFESPKIEQKTIDSDSSMLKTINSQIEYKYPLEPLTNIPFKLSVTEITKSSEMMPSLRAPNFSEDMTSAEKGTATHAFLQYADFPNVKNIDDEIKKLVEFEFLTPKQSEVLDKQALSEFFGSDLFSRMQSAKKIEREKSFLYEMPANEVYDDIDNNATILIQGIADCVIYENDGIVIVDYKTDKLSEEKLKHRYSSQLNLYKRALESITAMQVKECVLYSLHLNKQIVI